MGRKGSASVTGTTKQARGNTGAEKKTREKKPKMSPQEIEEKYGVQGSPLKYKINFEPKNRKQADLVELIREKDVIFTSGPSGSGKSYCAMACALQLLRESDNGFKKITLIVPTSQAGDSIGWLKGSLSDKLAPFADASLYTAQKIIDKSGGDGQKVLELLQENLQFEIKSSNFLRGQTLDNQLIIIEEAQNLSSTEIKTILTRISESAKMIFTGDIEQCDNQLLMKKGIKNGLEYALDRLSGMEEIGVISFDRSEIIRHPLISKILDKWDGE